LGGPCNMLYIKYKKIPCICHCSKYLTSILPDLSQNPVEQLHLQIYHSKVNLASYHIYSNESWIEPYWDIIHVP
jgi:hypothetical protein